MTSDAKELVREPESAGGGEAIVPEDDLPPRKDAYYSLFVITVVVMFTVLDRTVLALLIDPIKTDFGISDTQAALLVGAAFSLPYGIVALAVGRAADHMNRRNVIAIACTVWSLATCACGLAQGFVSLLIARMGIGAGEAGYGPAAWSIATDNWPREKVAFATGVMGIGAMVGMGLAYFLGGTVLHFVEGLDPMPIPGLGVIRPWQWAFILVGAPGVLWGLVVLTSKEPPRRGLAGKKAQKTPVSETVKWVRDDWRVYLATVGGMMIKMMLMAGPMVWGATFVHRTYGWDLSDVGMVKGAVTLVVSPLGMLAGAKVSEWWTKKGSQDANLRIVLYGTIVTLPLHAFAYLMPTAWGYFGLTAFAGFVAGLGFGPSIAAFQLITPNRMRGQLGGLVQFCNHVVAFLVGPLIVALFTDYLFGNEDDLRYSIVLNIAVMGTLALIVIGQGLGPYKRSYARALNDFKDVPEAEQ